VGLGVFHDRSGDASFHLGPGEGDLEYVAYVCVGAASIFEHEHGAEDALFRVNVEESDVTEVARAVDRSTWVVWVESKSGEEDVC
jgi:hypothetical protein